jgi:orotidine-5'-phosphate decarboxylase
MQFKNRLIIALDVDTTAQAEARRISSAPTPAALRWACSSTTVPAGAVRRLREKGVPVFVDLKLHDIPNTVAGAARVLTRHGASILNVHAAGGADMMAAAADASRDEAVRAGIKPPRVVAVTVLTSVSQDVFNKEIGFAGAIRDRVVSWALLAREAGLDGVVASPLEITPIREACGEDFVIITPVYAPRARRQTTRRGP